MNKDDSRKRITIHMFKRRITLPLRMLAICLAIMFVPVTTGLILYSMYSASIMEKQTFQSMQITVEQAKNNVDYRMQQIQESGMAILTSVYPYLNSVTPADGQLAEYREMTRLLMEYKGRQMISKLRLYVPSSKTYSKQADTFYSLDSLNQIDEALGPSYSSQSGTYWQEPHDITLSYGEQPLTVISCAISVTSESNYNEVVGVLFLDIGVSQFNKMLSSGISKEEYLFLVNSDGKVLSHPDSTKIGQQAFSAENLPDLKNVPVGHTTITDDEGSKKLMVYSKVDTTDWYLVMTVPDNRKFSSGFFSLDTFRLAILLVIVISFVISLNMIQNMVVQSTLLRINNAINELETEGFEPNERRHGPVDIISRKNKPNSLITLEKNANHMVMTIKALLDRQYKNQLAIRDYHMQALQAQINPHFLYNTLDVIKWMIADNKKDSSIWMVNALSRYFQLSISKGRDIVRIKEEIELTKTYLGIMQKRFKNVFTAEFFIDPAVENCLIPKLSLQPIVENALLHGILYTEKPNRILTIRGLPEDGQITISVEDNGHGIDDEKLESIRNGRDASKSYGLANVRERLELFGADADGFEISSKKDVGTCVTLRFPMRNYPENLNE